MHRRNPGAGKLVSLSAVFVFVALGTFTWPGDFLSSGFRPFQVAAVLYITGAFAPPGIVMAAALYSPIRESVGFGRLARVIILVLSGIALLGIVPAIIFIDTPGFPVHVARMMTIALQGLLCCQLLLNLNEDPLERRWHRSILAIPILAVSFWSLAAGVAAGAQAVFHANGKPYCIGDTRHPGLWYGELDSLFDLRGIDLVVSRTDGVSGSLHWSYHAILAVPGNPVSTRWNWSATRMRFDPISQERQRLLANPVSDVCTPKRNFLWTLIWP
ncbi:MAG: hypothetical protein ACFB13_03955 [Kiloniellaceae bacterium]